MMKTLKLQLLAGLFLGTLTLAGCKDECKDVDCGSNGECVDGSCVCDAGYLGGNCETSLSEKLSATYAIAEQCDLGGAKNYDVIISEGTLAPYQVVITKIWNSAQNSTINAVIGTDGKSLTFPKQPLGTSNYSLKSTSSTISADAKTIQLSYELYIDDSVFLENCTATLTR